jgi:hypothetical protein
MFAEQLIRQVYLLKLANTLGDQNSIARRATWQRCFMGVQTPSPAGTDAIQQVIGQQAPE